MIEESEVSEAHENNINCIIYNMDNTDFLLESYDYELPQELIAQVPAQPAESAKLLVWNRTNASIQDQHFFDLPKYLTNNDILICNNTKVFKARIPLVNTKIIRKSWEIRNVDGEIFVYQLLPNDKLECLVSDDKNFKPWSDIFLNENIVLHSESYAEDWIIFSVEWISIYEFLEEYGQMPLPPYIKYEKEKEKWYQTTFAKDLGSAAAPTASLHFSQNLLESIHKNWTDIYFTTLHVWLGTFKPVYEQDIRNQHLHLEPIIIEKSLFQTIYNWKKEKKNLIAVGTTMVRLLETLPYLRASLDLDEKKDVIQNVDAFNYWESVSLNIETSDIEKFVHNVLFHDIRIICDTQLFIFPGRNFRITNEIITNFHLPKSSLLMLVSAFMWRKNALCAYEHAKKMQYHFYSFWDGMWIRNI